MKLNAEIRQKLRKEKVESIADPRSQNAKKYLYIDSFNIKGDEKHLMEILDEIRQKDQREKLELPKLQSRRNFSKFPEIFSNNFISKIENYEQEVKQEMKTQGKAYLAPTLIELPEVSDQDEPEALDSPIRLPRKKDRKALTYLEPRSDSTSLLAVKNTRTATTIKSIGEGEEEEELKGNAALSRQSERVNSMNNIEEIDPTEAIKHKPLTHATTTVDGNITIHFSTEATHISTKPQEDSSMINTRLSLGQNLSQIDHQVEVKNMETSRSEAEKSSRVLKIETVKTEPDHSPRYVRPFTLQPSLDSIGNKTIKSLESPYDKVAHQIKIAKRIAQDTPNKGLINVHALNRVQSKEKRRDKGDLTDLHAGYTRQGISELFKESDPQEPILHRKLKKKLDTLTPRVKLDNPVFLTALSPINSRHGSEHFTLRTPESFQEKKRTTILKLKEINSPSPNRTLTLFRSMSDRKVDTPRAFQLTTKKVQNE